MGVCSLILNIFSSGSIETVFYALVWSSPLPMIHEFGVFMYSKDPCVLFYLLTFIFVMFECSNFSIVCPSHNILSSLWSSLSMSVSMELCVWFIEIFFSIIWSVLFPSWLHISVVWSLFHRVVLLGVHFWVCVLLCFCECVCSFKLSRISSNSFYFFVLFCLRHSVSV